MLELVEPRGMILKAEEFTSTQKAQPAPTLGTL